MSETIIVNSLTKIYGDQFALNKVSFKVRSNQITGFLGPNGAGKSTTMKILTGYLPPDDGAATVNGINVVEDPIGVKKVVGYLPEHNPLYLDMYVHEFLRFSGSLYGIKGKNLRDRVVHMIERTGLVKEQNKKIGSLSKGYRQRVGLAHALLHDPEILILDEPTTGLDPNQIEEVRNLIKDISKSRTVILSTHIMQEVQAICDHVVLINNGEIVADDDIKSLLSQKESKTILLETERSFDPVNMKIEGVLKVEKQEESVYKIFSDNSEGIRSRIAQWVTDHDYGLLGLKEEVSSMEDVFKSLTKTPKND